MSIYSSGRPEELRDELKGGLASEHTLNDAGLSFFSCCSNKKLWQRQLKGRSFILAHCSRVHHGREVRCQDLEIGSYMTSTGRNTKQ